MPEKPEPRVDVDLPIRVFGMGADGRPFLQDAQARNISDHGAKLSGLEKQLKPGDVIGVQVGEKKARYRVIWVVDAGHLQKIEVGVQLVEGQQCPWQKELERTQTVAETNAPSTAQTGNKRKFLRQRVPFSLEIRDEQGMNMRTKAADISGRGCYVETMLPLPVGKVLHITLWSDAERITTPAIVRTCDGGVGMGLEFTGLDEETQVRLQQQVEAMAAESGLSKNAQGTF
jgi:hypothetical protein